MNKAQGFGLAIVLLSSVIVGNYCIHFQKREIKKQALLQLLKQDIETVAHLKQHKSLAAYQQVAVLDKHMHMVEAELETMDSIFC